MARHNDINPATSVAKGPSLPPINWARIKQTPPVPLPIDHRLPDDPLPAADVVVVTWTSAEWSALDHVFAGDEGVERSSEDRSWKQNWFAYTRNVGTFSPDQKSGPLWGYFRLVQITDLSQRPWRVLLFKSNSHLAHPPWIDGLSTMTRLILADTGADRIFSIGTAGGGRLSARLGDVIVTNAALLRLERPQNMMDRDNGALFRCQTWFPPSSLRAEIESNLLYRLNGLVTQNSLAEMLEQLKLRSADDRERARLTLEDLVNDPINPTNLGTPRIHMLKDVPLLTTDFYFIGADDDAEAYSFLEMDDAVIAREAGRLGVRYNFIRNVSDPIVGTRTRDARPLSDRVRGDWSALIYEQCGFATSFNGALATWGAIAGEGAAAYDPPRTGSVSPAEVEGDPLEVKLVRQVRGCNTCSFFWPEAKSQQPYGPYTAFDLSSNTPHTILAGPGRNARPWVMGRTRPPAFPDPEVADGCRKAPIMTIGINPNLTAFLPGQRGAAWAYPSFSNDDGTDAWTKYAWYYRYRTVYQERYSLEFARKFILPEGRVYAPRNGRVMAAARPDDSPSWTVTVRYDGDSTDTLLTLNGRLGDFPYVLLFDAFPPNNAFVAGDIIAGRIAVPGGIQESVLQEPQGYYTQFQPTLQRFQETLHNAGHTTASLQIGEDVSQLDMVACASPHWNPGFLGGTPESVAQVVHNCVSSNAWAIKQLIQTRPAVLYIVSEHSWNMLWQWFGAHVRSAKPLPAHPEDHDFSLLRLTTDPKQPVYLDFDVDLDGMRYQHQTRLVITPHFSYGYNFVPQYRLSQTNWKDFSAKYPDCVAALTQANGFHLIPADPQKPGSYVVIRLDDDPAAALTLLKTKLPVAADALEPFFYDPHAMMASVLDDLYRTGTLAWMDTGTGAGYLARTEGSCHFCVNRHWSFPNECRYGKHKEQPPPPDFLERVAERIVATGTPAQVLPPPPLPPMPQPSGLSPVSAVS